MILIPSIDLRNGRCVRLLKGNFNQETRYDLEPHELMQRYRALGATWCTSWTSTAPRTASWPTAASSSAWRHRRRCTCRWAAACRSAAVVDDLLRNGIDRVIVGSAAVEHPAEVQAWLKRYGAEKIGLAFDIRHDCARGSARPDPRLDAGVEADALGSDRFLSSAWSAARVVHRRRTRRRDAGPSGEAVPGVHRRYPQIQCRPPAACAARPISPRSPTSAAPPPSAARPCSRKPSNLRS